MARAASTYISELARLRAERLPFETTWKDCFDYTYPLLGAGLQDSADASSAIAQANQKKVSKLYDSTAPDAARLLASALLSGLTPANTRWFTLDGTPKNGTVQSLVAKRWLDDTGKRIWESIHEGNYDSVGLEVLLSWVIAGWGTMYEDLAPDGSLRFTGWPMPECFCAQSVKGGPIDTIYRPFKMTAMQAIGEYGDDNLDDMVRQAPSGKEFNFLWVIEPRRAGKQGAAARKAMPWASVHICTDTRTTVRESGYQEWPGITPRWLPLPNSAYAVGPVYEVLPDVKTLNQVVQYVLMNCDLATAGMWIAEDDGVLNTRTLEIGPRKVVVANSVDSMKALEPAGDFNVSFVEIEKLQTSIRRGLMADQLQLPQNVTMTATEVTARLEQLRQLLAPILGRLQSEFLQPLIRRSFSLLMDSGQIAPPPPELKDMTIRYVSPLARAQRMVEVNVMDRIEQDILNTASVTQSVDILDLYDFENAKREKAALLGVPLKLLRSESDIRKIRADRKEQQQQTQKLDAMDEAALKLAQGA